MNVRTLFLIIAVFAAGLSAGALIPVYFISTNFRAEEPSCSLERAFREISIGETAYCRCFRLYRRGDGSLVVYRINHDVQEDGKTPERNKSLISKKTGGSND